MASKRDEKTSEKKRDPKLEKREEKVHRDLDHDKEKGESKAHRENVLGKMKPCGHPAGKPCAHDKKGKK